MVVCAAAGFVYFVLSYNGDEFKPMSRQRFWFISMWVPAHDFFPVTFKVWDGEKYVTTGPNEGHLRAFDGPMKSRPKQEGAGGPSTSGPRNDSCS